MRGAIRRKTREVRAVDDVTFTIRMGEAIAIFGRNGAGNTTLIKLLFPL